MPLPADGSKVKLGKGSLLLDTLTNQGVSTGFDFVGNVTALELSSDVTKAELFSSTERSAPKIAESITRLGYSLVATCSEYTKRNLEKFLLGALATKQQAIQAAQAFTIDAVVPGRFYDLGARRITNLVATFDGTAAAVAGTDYRVASAEFGLIQILEGGGIPEGSSFEGTFDQPELTIDQIRIARNSAPVCHLLYLADDANQDGDASRDRLEIWKVSLAPEGSLNFISDDYGNFQLSMGVLSDAVNHPDDPFGTLDRIRE